MNKSVFLLPALALAMGLASCSASQPDSAASEIPTASATAVEPSVTPAPSATAVEDTTAEYAFATGMTFGKIHTAGEPSPELRAFLKAAAEAEGDTYDDDFTFWTVKIDNREGQAEAFPNEFRAYDKDGGEYLFVGTLDLVEVVQDQLPDAPDAKVDSPEWKSYEKLFSKYEAAFDSEQLVANPGAVKEFTVVTGDELPDEFTRMTIDLGGLVGEAEVIPLEDAQSQGYPLDF